MQMWINILGDEQVEKNLSSEWHSEMDMVKLIRYRKIIFTHCIIPSGQAGHSPVAAGSRVSDRLWPQ